MALPVAPSNLAIETLGPDQIHLSWEDNAPDADLLVVERKDGPQGQWEGAVYLPGGTAQWDDHGVTAGGSYYYRVRSVEGAVYSPFSNFVMGVAGTVPTAPVNLIATPFTPVVIDLTWLDQSAVESGFEIQRRQGEFGAWLDLFPRPPTNTQWARVPGVLSGTPYTFRIRAYNEFGKSAWRLGNTTRTRPCSWPPRVPTARGWSKTC